METTGNVQVDAQNDVTALVTQGRQAALDEVNAMASAIDKLMSQAAGDAPVLLTEAEKQAAPEIASHVPSFLRGVVAGAITSVLQGNAYQGMFDAMVMKGLAYAEAEVANIQAHMINVIKTI